MVIFLKLKNQFGKIVKNGGKQMNYDVLDVSRYIISYSNKMDYGISNLKLQKVLYFCQAYFLIQTGHPCFNEKIEAWDFGPVVPVAYKEFKKFAGMDIPTMYSHIVFNGNEFFSGIERVDFKEICISNDDRTLIDKVVDKFSEYSSTDMVKLTQHQTPWIDAINSYQSNEITNKSIFEYFKSF